MVTRPAATETIAAARKGRCGLHRVFVLPGMGAVLLLRNRCRTATVIGGSALIAGLFLLFMLLAASGCAVGRTQSGGVVVGPELGQLVETTNEALNKLGDSLLPGLGVLLTAVGVPAIGWARAKARADSERAASAAHDEAWDQALDETLGRGPSRPAPADRSGGDSGGAGGGVPASPTT